MPPRLILGLGTGFCGTGSLTEILNRQPDHRVSAGELPVVPWSLPDAARLLGERFGRIRRQRNGNVVGDVAPSYLPHVSEIIDLEPEVRIVCLKRPREEVIAEFSQWLDESFPLSINHWAKQNAAGWYRDPVWSRAYPRYDIQDRTEGLRRYWDDYYTLAERWLREFPDHFRVFGTHEALNTEEGQRELLAFVGVPREQQVLAVGTHLRRGPDRVPRPPAKRTSKHPMDPRRCVILVPFHGAIMAPCEAALRELERRGYDVRRIGGYAAIDQGRNQMATDALIDGYEETMWIDADTDFHPDAIDQLRGHNEPIVAGVCAQKAKRAIACHILPGTRSMRFGKGGGLVEMLYAGTGFMLVRRVVYEAMQEQLALPVCNERFGSPMVPYFQPMLHPIEEGHWYLAEDYAFCQRARQCGFRILADTSIRLWHVGNYAYGWEDAGMERRRFASFTLDFGPGPSGNGHASRDESPGEAREQVPLEKGGSAAS